MTLFTSNYSFPFPELSDIPDGATETENLAIAIDAQVKSNADSSAAAVTRTALLTALLGTAGARYTKFTAAQTVTTTTSTSYVNMVSGATLCGHSFVAPPSGITRIAWGVNAFSSVQPGSTVFVGVSVALGSTVGSGTSILAANNDEAIQIGNAPGYRCRYQTALTPGTTYNCWIMWRNTGAATATAFLPFIESEPVLA